MKLHLPLLLSVCFLGQSWSSLGAADDAEAKAVAFVEKLGGTVIRDDKAEGKPVRDVYLIGAAVTDKELKGLKDIKTLQTLNLMNNAVTDKGLIELKEIKGLQTLNLSVNKVTDAGLKELTALKQLKWLSLDYCTQVTDAGLKELATVKQLQWLSLLGCTQVTDAGLKELTPLKQLQSLNLNRCDKVTDVGLKELKELKSLQTPHLHDAKVTDAGLKELLDWLAVELRESGWDIKHMVRLMVLARTYRQVSTVRPEVKEIDPYNRLLAQQARFRLDAEMVRDNALATSGLLVRKIGGVSVKPYQPAGYWALLNFPKREWANSEGDDLYRRGLYTYWCRTFPHPSLAAFDAPSREECVVERPRANTPLQALVLLNDPTYVEAARVFAERILKEGGMRPEDRVQFAFRQALQRRAQPAELQIVLTLFHKHLEQYRANPKAAADVLTVGEKLAPKDLNAAELAAWTAVTRVILNLHETITRN